MINLMPPAYKDSILFARRNVTIVRWIIGLAVAAILLALAASASMFLLKNETAALKDEVAKTEEHLKSQNETETLEKVQKISENFSLVVDVLSKEVLFSKLLQHMGTIMPDGTILRNLTLSDDFEGGVELSIGSVDYLSASQALVNIKDDESLLFTDADAIRINCEGTEDEAPYFCTATVQALLVENNPFMLLNQGAANE